MASKVQDCDCGFTDSTDPTNSTFTSFFVVNFSSITSQQLDDLFIPATYEIDGRDQPYTRNFSSDQVQLSDAGLKLTVSPAESQKVPCGQIFTRAATFSHGSYHARFQVGNVPGTVTAFFNYKNDSSEVDIEYISAWDDPTLLYTVKPQIYADNGNPSTDTYQRETWNDTSSAFDANSHEWSFIWLPEVVHFGLDGKYSRSLTTNVPQAPGRLSLSHWSDGNPKYSLGPPTQSTTVTISLLWAVYNDVNASALTCEKATSVCEITNGIFSTNDSASDDNHDSTSPSSINVNNAHSIGSSHSISSASCGWIFVVLFISWFCSWRSR